MISDNQLPNGWQLQPIPEVVFFQEGPGVRKHQYADSGVKLLNVGNINGGKIDLDATSRYVTEDEAYGRYKHFLVDDGDLLIGSSGITVDTFDKKIAFVGPEHLPLCMNTSTIRFKPLDRNTLDINYFKYFLGTSLFKGQLRRLITGTAQLNFGPSHLAQMVIPLPLLSEQKRIADILDKADAIRRKRQDAGEHATDFLASTLQDMFGDPVTNPMGWPEATLQDVAHLQSGVTKGRKLDGKETVDVPYMRVWNVQDGHLRLGDIKDIAVLPTDVEKYRLEEGDLLLTEGGDPDQLGRGAIWYAPIPLCIHQNHIFRVRANQELVIPEFLSALIGSQRGKRYFLKMAKQTTGIASINMTQLKKCPVFLPPLDLQKKYAKVERQFEATKTSLSNRFDVLDELFNSLVQRAFKGEL